jgi:type II secretory pathway component PulF
MKSRLVYKWIDFGIAVAVWGVVEFVLVTVGPAFADIYSQFGGELLAPTRFFLWLNGFPGAALIPTILAGLVVFQFWRTIFLPPPLPGSVKWPWDSRVVLAVILLGAFTFLFAVVSLYAPIFTLGNDLRR